MKIAIVIVAIIAIMGLLLFWYWYKKHATPEERARVDTWLLAEVATAQREWNEGTGPLKKSVVYAAFVALFPDLVCKIPIGLFELMIDNTLATLVRLGKEKPKIKAYMDGK